jgi:hypothetical protein
VFDTSLRSGPSDQNVTYGRPTRYPFAMHWSCRVVLTLLLTACSSSGQGSGGADGSGDGTSSGVVPAEGSAPSDALLDVNAPAIDPNTLFTSLTSAQIAEICDWEESLLGGYDAAISCQIGTMNNFANQAQCVGALTFIPGSCSLTVGGYEMCVLARVPSKGCDNPDPQCSEYFVCNRSGG